MSGYFLCRNRVNGIYLNMTLADQFLRDGFVPVRDAFSPSTARRYVEVVRNILKRDSVDLNDPSTWSNPVVRINCPNDPAFTEAGTSPKLFEIYDQLLGPGNWIPRQGVGGTLPIRFPHRDDPGDAGWHIDGSFDLEGSYGVNLRSKSRGLLALFLFTDIEAKDAPTEIIRGSHLDVPKVLVPFGDNGVRFGRVAHLLPTSTYERPRALATGRAGDVYICHPFLVHRATWPHQGTSPRIIAQPEVRLSEPFKLIERPDCFPVERAILNSLQEQT